MAALASPRLKNWPNVAIAGFFLSLAILLRLFSFFYSSIDQDETTYLIIAREMLKGARLYVDVWDTKPAGIFLLFAGFQSLFGDSILMIRLMASLFAGFTAFLLFLASKKYFESFPSALWSGIIYLVFLSLHRNGLPANTEIFFNAFTAATILLLLYPLSWLRSALAGLLMGLAFMIKYVVLPDAATLFLFLILLRPGFSLSKRIIATAAAGLMFLMPFLFAHIIYFFNGHFEAFIWATYKVSGNYPNLFNPIKTLNFLLSFLLMYLPLVALLVLSLRKMLRTETFMFWFAMCWILLVWIMMIIPGKFFFHYYIQALIPFSFFTGRWIAEAYARFGKPLRRAWLLLAVLLIYGWIWQGQAFCLRPDLPARISETLNKRMLPDDKLYVSYNNAVYYLTHKTPPTKYVHQTLISHPEHIRALQINTDSIFAHIIEQQPDWLVIQGSGHVKIQEYILRHCTLVDSVGEKGIRIFRRSEF